MIFFGIVLNILLIALALTFYYNSKIEEKQNKKDFAWLEEQMKQPKHYVKFVLNSGEIKETLILDPYIVNPGSEFGMLSKSLDRAQFLLEYSYKRGFFTDKDGKTYPVCSITQASVEVA